MNAADLERVLGEIAHQILDHGIDSLGQWGCTQVTVEFCPDRARGVIEAGACRIGVCTTEPGQLLLLLELAPQGSLRSLLNSRFAELGEDRKRQIVYDIAVGMR